MSDELGQYMYAASYTANEDTTLLSLILILILLKPLEL